MISLRTAAVYGNKLWARLGRSQLIAIHKGKGFEEAEVIDNNILNGGKGRVTKVVEELPQ